jgi:hypothetical protein
MSYKVKKSIQQYSIVDLLEIIINENHQEYQLAKNEFQKRKPSKKELEVAKKGLEIRIKSRNKPLSTIDKIYCFIIPFTANKSPFVNRVTQLNNEHESHLDEFKMYGETKRVEELKKWQKYGKTTHIILLGLIALIGLVFVSLL